MYSLYHIYLLLHLERAKLLPPDNDHDHKPGPVHYNQATTTKPLDYNRLNYTQIHKQGSLYPSNSVKFDIFRYVSLAKRHMYHNLMSTL